MKSPSGCKLFGAHQALSGIHDAVVLLHSVVGCNFGSLSFHLPGDMAKIHQTCTVISDDEVVFGGEQSLIRALTHAEELFSPQVIFVVSGCVSDIVQDNISAVATGYQGKAQVITVEAAGYRGNFSVGYEDALCALFPLMEECPKSETPSINLIGLGADDPHLRWELSALKELLGDKVQLQSVLPCCSVAQIKAAPAARFNLVLGRGEALAKVMLERFSIPYSVIDYPYGLTGAKALWKQLEQAFGLDFSAEQEAFRQVAAEGLRPAYGRLQALYGMPAAVIADRGRCRGLIRFLTRELGMEVVCRTEREILDDLDNFYDQVRASEAAVLFGSSFEAQLSDELGIPLVRIDYPVFDRVCISDRPYVGTRGSICLIEEMLNEIMVARRQKGALYQ